MASTPRLTKEETNISPDTIKGCKTRWFPKTILTFVKKTKRILTYHFRYAPRPTIAIRRLLLGKTLLFILNLFLIRFRDSNQTAPITAEAAQKVTKNGIIVSINETIHRGFYAKTFDNMMFGFLILALFNKIVFGMDGVIRDSDASFSTIKYAFKHLIDRFLAKYDKSKDPKKYKKMENLFKLKREQTLIYGLEDEYAYILSDHIFLIYLIENKGDKYLQEVKLRLLHNLWISEMMKSAWNNVRNHKLIKENEAYTKIENQYSKTMKSDYEKYIYGIGDWIKDKSHFDALRVLCKVLGEELIKQVKAAVKNINKKYHPNFSGLERFLIDPHNKNYHVYNDEISLTLRDEIFIKNMKAQMKIARRKNVPAVFVIGAAHGRRIRQYFGENYDGNKISYKTLYDTLPKKSADKWYKKIETTYRNLDMLRKKKKEGSSSVKK